MSVPGTGQGGHIAPGLDAVWWFLVKQFRNYLRYDLILDDRDPPTPDKSSTYLQNVQTATLLKFTLSTRSFLKNEKIPQEFLGSHNPFNYRHHS